MSFEKDFYDLLVKYDTEDRPFVEVYGQDNIDQFLKDFKKIYARRGYKASFGRLTKEEFSLARKKAWVTRKKNAKKNK